MSVSTAAVRGVREWIGHNVPRVLERSTLALWAVAAIIAPIVVFVVLNDRIMKAPLGYDEQFFVWGGWNILRGQRPYVDFFEFKPPMVFITHALALALAGTKGLYYRASFSALALLSLTGLHLSVASRGIPRALGVAFLVAVTYQWVNPAYHDNALQDAESIGLIYYFAALAALLANSGRHRRWFEMAGGAFLALNALSKEPFVGVVVGTWVTAFFVNYGTTDIRKHVVHYVKNTAIGAGIVVLGIVLYMGPTGALRRYVELVIEYAALFRNPKTSYCVVLGRWKPGTPLHDLLAQVQYIRAQFFNVATIGYLTPFFVVSFVFTWVRSRLLFVCSFVTMLLSIYAVTATNCQWPHYYNMALPGIFLFCLVGLDSLKPYMEGCPPLVRHWIGAVFLGTIAVFVSPRFLSEFEGYPYKWAKITDPVPGVYDFIAKNTVPSDRIFTTGEPQLYMYANRLSALRESSIIDEFMDYYPGNTDVEKVRHLREQLVRNRPKVIILDPGFASRKVRHMNALMTPFINDFGYQKVGSDFYVRPN